MARSCCVRLACIVLTTLTAIALSIQGVAQATIPSDSKPSASQHALHPIPQRPTFFARSSREQAPAAPVPDQSGPVHQVHRTESPAGEFNIVYSVLGLGFNFPNFELSAPRPNANLAVGTTEAVQAVDFSYADFNKATGALIPLDGLTNTPGNTVWANLLPGTLCGTHNDGELIVQFDRAAARWVLVQNVTSTSPFAVCIAVSQTSTFSDNMWFAYQFPVVSNGLPDYQKFAVWSTGGQSDGYFQTWNNLGPGGSGFIGAVACGYDRQKMLLGDPSAEQICFQLPAADASLLPADVDSATLPPAGEDEFFIGGVGAVDNSHLSLYSFHVVSFPGNMADFNGQNNSQLLSIAAFTPACNPNYTGNCVPQPGTSTELQSLGDRLMYRFAYHSDAGSFSSVPVTALSVFQQGTYAGDPVDGNSRWMGSIATDNVNDILIGYSESSASQFPSIAVAGRVLTDPLGTLGPEVSVVNGTQSQQSSPWGGYTSMRIDPTDNCTFFYTSEFYQISSVLPDWSTELLSVKFSNCHVDNKGPAPITPSQHWYVSFDVANSGGSLGVRWMELTAPSLAPTQTTVASLPNPSTYLEPVASTATVTPSGCTGTVDFVDTFNGPPTTLCAGVPLDINGMAICTTTTLAVGTHSQLVANYSGDSECEPSQGTDTPSQVVNQASSLVGIVANPPSPSHLGQPVTFTATVTGQNGGSPTGTASFLDNGSPISGCSNVMLTPQSNGSTATCLDIALAVGTHSIVVNYVGDANFLAGSGTIPYQVLPATGTTTTLTVTPNPATAGQVVNLTATVTCGLVPAPVGSVTFMSGTHNLGTVQIARQSGTATLLDRFAPGQYQLTALYNGNNSCNSSTSSPQSLTVTGSESTTCTLAAQPDGSNFDFNLSLFGFGFPPLAGSAGLNNLTAGGTLIGTIPVNGNGTLAFQPANTYPTGNLSIAAVSGDFNGDGFPDLAVLNQVGNSITILLGNGDGTFHAGATLNGGSNPEGIAAADLNSDGALDLVVASEGSRSLQVYFGNGDGTFQAQPPILLEFGPNSVAMGDFNNDGLPDVVVSGFLNGASVEVFLNEGGGNLMPGQIFPAGVQPVAIAVGDFNHDGNLDVAVADAQNQAIVLVGDGDGGFSATHTVTVTGGPISIAAADLRRNGKVDLVLGDQLDNMVSVLLGNGDGTFQPEATYAAGQSPVGVAVADFTGSGIPDLAVASTSDSSIRVLLGNGDGTFQPQMTFPTGGEPWALAIADFNGDGFPDVASSNYVSNTASILRGGTANTGQLLNLTVTGNGPQNLQANFMPTGSIYAACQSNIVTVTPPAQIPTTTAVMSSMNPSNVGQQISLTAAVMSSAGPASGQVLFQSNGGSIAECPNPIMLNSSGVASCTTSSLPAGSDTILASFSDPQGVYANSSGTLTQTVLSGGGDFVIVPLTPPSISVAQTFSNITDPFFTQAVPVRVHGLNGYSGIVSLSCSVSPALAAGSCVVNSPSSGLVDDDLVTTLTVSTGAGTQVGNYMITVSGQDNSGRMHQVSQNLMVIQNGPGVGMPPGGGGPPIQVYFPGPPGTTYSNPSCPQVNGTGLNGNQPLSMIGGVCTFTPTSGTFPGPTQLVISGCEVARLHTRVPIYASLFFGLPGVVFVGALGRRGSRRKRLLRILALIVAGGAILFAVACGGYGKLTPVGHYQVLVQVTGQDGTVYSAEVPVTVNPLQ